MDSEHRIGQGFRAIFLAQIHRMRGRLHTQLGQMRNRRVKLVGFARGDGNGRAELAERLEAALAETLPARLDEGGVIAPGYDPELDEARRLRDATRQVLAEQQGVLAARYDVPNLKIRHHAQLGYVLEVPAAAVAKLRAHPDLILRQGMANGARFSTSELVLLNQRIVEAGERAAARERGLFAALVARILACSAPLAACAAALARLDVLCSAADLAAGGTWCRPVVSEDRSFRITALRHPVVEAALAGRAAADSWSSRTEEVEAVSLPTGCTVHMQSLRISLDANGSVQQVSIGYAVEDASGAAMGSRVHTLTQKARMHTDACVADGKTTAFAATAAPYDGAQPTVQVARVSVTTGYTAAANADGAWTVTFSKPPAKDASVALTYAAGPALSNSAGDLLATLGLTAGTGTVYSSTAATTSHQTVGDAAAVLRAWAEARVLADVFGG